MIQKRKLLAAAAATALSFGVAAQTKPGAAAASKEDIVFGASVPMTGVFAFAGIGIDAGAKRCNPLIWTVRLRDMLAPAFYSKLRWNLFRMHYQFIMANDMRAPYEYMMLVCGPVPGRVQ